MGINGKNKAARWVKAAMVNTSFLARGWRVGEVNGRILMYHRVDEVKGDRLVVSPKAFLEQMEWLRRRQIRVVDLETLVESLHHPQKGDNQLAITFDDGYEDNYRYAWPILRSFGYTATLFIPAMLIGTQYQIPAQRVGATPGRLMSWEQLEEMAAGGIMVGAHGLTHKQLTQLSLGQVRAEVSDSKKMIEERTGRPVDWFCYPNGAFSYDVVRLVQWAGYHGACSIRPGSNTFKTHRFALRRTEISAEDTLITFQRKLAGAYDLWHKTVQTYMRWERHRKKQAERPHV